MYLKYVLLLERLDILIKQITNHICPNMTYCFYLYYELDMKRYII